MIILAKIIQSCRGNVPVYQIVCWRYDIGQRGYEAAQVSVMTGKYVGREPNLSHPSYHISSWRLHITGKYATKPCQLFEHQMVRLGGQI